MLEQHYVIKFLVKKKNGPKETHRRLEAVYSNEAMTQWSESKSADEYRRFNEGVKICPIPLDQDNS
jgi:hypothetical protein